MERSSRGRARSAPKLFHEETTDDAPPPPPKPWAGVLHNGTEVEFMRIERLQEALEGLGLDTEGKRFNLLQRLAEALKGSSGGDPLEHEQVAAQKDDAWILASVVRYDADQDVYEVRDEAEAHERRAAVTLDAAGAAGKMKVRELRNALEDLGEETDGAKPVLVERLVSARRRAAPPVPAIQLPADRVRRLGVDQDALREGEHVLAVYPARDAEGRTPDDPDFNAKTIHGMEWTTTFYRAAVARKPIQARDDGCIRLVFDGEDEQIHRVSRHYVIRETPLSVDAPSPSPSGPQISGYMHFMQQKRPEITEAVRAERPTNLSAQVTKRLGEMWQRLGKSDREKYKREAPLKDDVPGWGAKKPRKKRKKKETVQVARQTPRPVPHPGYVPPALPEGAVPLPAVVREIAPLLGPPRSYNFDEAAARAAFEDADRRYSALKGIEKRLEDELARLRVEEAALRAAAGEVDEEGWAQFDPARDGSETLEAV
jgi:hypothetical protein